MMALHRRALLLLMVVFGVNDTAGESSRGNGLLWNMNLAFGRRVAAPPRGGGAITTTRDQSSDDTEMYHVLGILHGEKMSKTSFVLTPMAVESSESSESKSPETTNRAMTWSSNNNHNNNEKETLLLILGMLANRVVLVLNDTDATTPLLECVSLLLRGIQQGQRNHKIVLDIVLQLDQDDVVDDDDAFREALAHSVEKALQDELETVETSSLLELRPVQVLHRTDPTISDEFQQGGKSTVPTSQPVTLSLFPKLVQSMYQSLQGSKEQGSFSLTMEDSSTTVSLSSSFVPTTQDKDSTPPPPRLRHGDEILAQALESLRELQQDLSSTRESFARQANRILETMLKQYQDCLETVSTVELQSFKANRQEDLVQVATRLRQMYDDYLDELREEYGRQFEAVLDGSVDDDDTTAVGAPSPKVGVFWRRWRRERQEPSSPPPPSPTIAERARSTAAQITADFRTWAQTSIPTLCQEGGPLCKEVEFDYVMKLQGLIQDCMQVTLWRNEDLYKAIWGNGEEEEKEGMEEEPDEPRPRRWLRWRLGLGGRRREGPRKWYETLALRVLALAVNYVQGYLALQALRRAASQRDLHAPKFPLF